MLTLHEKYKKNDMEHRKDTFGFAGIISADQVSKMAGTSSWSLHYEITT